MRSRLVASLGLLVACTDDPITVDQSNHPIDKLFAALGKLPLENTKRIEGPPSSPRDDGDFQCVTTPIDEVRQYDELLGQLAVGDVV